MWEGGVRGAGLVHSPLLEKPGRSLQKITYITDWYNTLAHLAGLENDNSRDSHNIWDMLSKDKGNPRTEVVLNLDQDNFKGLWQAAIRYVGIKIDRSIIFFYFHLYLNQLKTF